MRSLLLLAAVCCLVLSAWASPIAKPEDDKEVGRQSAAAPAPAPAASAEDEDDDDDDDDDDGTADPFEDDDDDEDDEDDDDEEADDDEDDYDLERFFDDILGGEDDDDDDDEPSAVQPVAAPADVVAAAPAVPAASAEEVPTIPEEAESVEGETIADAEEPEAGQKEPASAEVESPASSAEAVAPADTDAEEDDEEEDDITDALDPEEDDDDDDDDEEEDDDDEDDDISDALGRKISSKHSRALKEEPAKKPVVPAIYIVKYNKFVDNILEKMNEILRRSYDPVNVKLQPIDAKKKSSKPKKDKTKTKSKKKSSAKKKQTTRAGSLAMTTNHKTIESLTNGNEIRDIPLVDQKVMEATKESPQNTETRALKEKSGTETAKAKPTTTRPKPPTNATKPKPKPPVKTTTKKPVDKNKTKTGEKSKPRAKGTLYGLSSLRRTGDVAVSILSDHTTVKSNFAVGPLILKVEKEVGRGGKKEIKSATATTAEMSGKITLRVNNQGVATLHAIKVLQPKQVRVDSNHERTRELVWKRSARIAHVVSEKLMSASKPMFLQHA
ncbi:unnamed protein product [Parnassius mnemosyne]|uniref:Acidic repeat-containing protein-like n=1 Tax=Parnassius mnemosyne TaxID=213953 RepID=A0AAV1LLE8_9NEOP